MRSDPEVDYMPDSAVDDAMDAELRKLLTTCFTKPQDTVIKELSDVRWPRSEVYLPGPKF